MTRRDLIELSVTIALVAVAALCHFALGDVTTFVVAAIALAALARLVGGATEQLGSRLGSGSAGVVQSALGNMPELFVALFALNSGLVTVVQAALVGSILANSVLVLGIAFFVGGLKNGLQRFSSDRDPDGLDSDAARSGHARDALARAHFHSPGRRALEHAVAHLRRRPPRRLLLHAADCSCSETPRARSTSRRGGRSRQPQSCSASPASERRSPPTGSSTR